MKTKKLIIVGDSAFAEIAYEYFQHDSEYEVVCFCVEHKFLTRKKFRGLPVVIFEEIEVHFAPNDYFVYVATAYTQLNRLRTRLKNAVKDKGYKLASYISRRAFVWQNVEIGEHCFIFEDNTLQPFVKLGDNVVLWSGNHIGHHSIVRDNCFIASHAIISGFCDIGQNSFIGVNSTIVNNVKIGSDNWIGPHSVIFKNTSSGTIYKTDQTETANVSTARFFNFEQ